MGIPYSKKQFLACERAAVNVLDTFDGESDPKEFLQKIRSIRDDTPIKHSSLKAIVISKLVGKAQAWILKCKPEYLKWTLDDLLLFIHLEYGKEPKRLPADDYLDAVAIERTERSLKLMEKRFTMLLLLDMNTEAPKLVKEFIEIQKLLLEDDPAVGTTAQLLEEFLYDALEKCMDEENEKLEEDLRDWIEKLSRFITFELKSDRSLGEKEASSSNFEEIFGVSPITADPVQYSETLKLWIQN